MYEEEIVNPRDEGIVSRTLYGVMHQAEKAVDYAKEEPLKAFLYAAAFAAAGYGVYRTATYPFPMFGGGVLRMNDQSYRFTSGDRLWMGRMVIGEVGDSGWDRPDSVEANQRAGAAVLWAVATRHMTMPSLFRSGSFTRTMRAFSQPINPIWASPGACVDGRGCCGDVFGACSPRKLQRRFVIRTKPWLGLPSAVRRLVDEFVAGRVQNPIPGYNNFAASGSIGRSALAASSLSPVTIGSNTFVRDPGSASGEVRFA